jgi:hypothetical protein
MMKRLIYMLGLVAAVCLAGCESIPGARAISLQSPDAVRVRASLANWPRPEPGGELRRPFFATMRVAGIRTTAQGILEYRGPRNFRVTAVTEMGVILFDGRVDWGGVTVLRQMPGLQTAAIEAMLTDMVRAFDLPKDLDGLKAGDSKLVISRKLADTHDYTWIFNREDGRLMQTEVSLGLLDTLRIGYEGYTARGWPKDLQVARRARLYDVSFTFTDDVVVQGNEGH